GVAARGAATPPSAEEQGRRLVVMSMVIHLFEQPERFVAGTVGPPGQRTFFLQARDGSRVTSVALEKQQVSVLAERLDVLLDEVLRQAHGDASIPAVAPSGSTDSEPLEQPIVEEFRVGTITLSWESEDQVVVIELFPISEETVVVETETESEEVEPGDVEPEIEVEVEVEASEVLVVKLAPGYARAFAKRAQTVVAAGRPPCQFCGNPIDPEGHICPRANGFRRILE
ncbi:MAG: DUF3090 family protein, partial [Nocardioidaceae bacterium]